MQISSARSNDRDLRPPVQGSASARLTFAGMKYDLVGCGTVAAVASWRYTPLRKQDAAVARIA